MLPVQDKTVFVYRLEKESGDVDKQEYNSADFVARMNIQPADSETTVMVDGVFGKTFRAFTTNSGIVEGMKVTVSGISSDYLVKGRQPHDNGILPAHYELILIGYER